MQCFECPSTALPFQPPEKLSRHSHITPHAGDKSEAASKIREVESALLRQGKVAPQEGGKGGQQGQGAKGGGSKAGGGGKGAAESRARLMDQQKHVEGCHAKVWVGVCRWCDAALCFGVCCVGLCRAVMCCVALCMMLYMLHLPPETCHIRWCARNSLHKRYQSGAQHRHA